MQNETLLPLVEAVQKATGRRNHLSTILRWSQRPNRHGIRLESWIVGGRRLTKISSVLAYIEANTRAADRYAVPTQTNSQVEAAHEAAVKELDAEGV